MANMPEERQSHHVQSLARGLSVITAFGPDTPELSLSDVARATGLTRAAARRFLLTLVDLGHVRQDGKLFRLTPRVLTLGYAYLSSLSLPGIAEPHLERLVREVHESSSMSVLDGHDIVYVARVPTSRIMTVAINVGTRFPAYATSMGRVLLAGLDEPALEEHLATLDLERFTDHTVASLDDLRARIAETRAHGYALVDQELEHGLRSIAAPVRNRHGKVVAAVNVSSHVSRVTRDRARKELLPPLLRAVREIETDLSRTQ
jgi:IclR family pca regulon transcriptional regulator